MFEGQNYDQATKLIQNSNRILLLTHKDAGGDGDALGSLLGLSFALSKLGRKIYPVMEEEISSNFSFLPGLEMLDKEINNDPDLIILLDSAELKRCSFFDQTAQIIKRAPSILIDHHPKGDFHTFCTFKLWDERAAATTEIVYFLINSLAIPLDKNIATCLLLGIFTDTNSFQNPNTTARTLKIASSLLSFGAQLSKIAEHAFYEKPLGVLKLWGRALARLWKNPKYNLLVTVLNSSDFKECGVGEEGANGVANFLSLSSLPDSAGVLVLIEENGKIKGSLRTQKEGIDVSKLATVLGGGGHQKAAGFTLEGKLKIDKGGWKIL